MSKKIAIWVCSNSALDYIEYPQDISILRSTINFSSGSDVYEDYLDMDADTFYKHLDESPDDIPKTAYVSVGKVEAFLQQEKDRGVTDVIAILISSNLSGLYSFFEQFAHQNSDDTLKIHPYDSKTLVYAQSYMVLTAHKMAAEGHSIDEITRVLDAIRDNNKLFFAVDTLKYLVVNGRLSKSSAMIGNFLKVRPLLHLEDGKVVPLEKARTTKAAVAKMLQKYFDETSNKSVLTYISHASNYEEAERLKEQIVTQYPEREVVICPLTPVVGAHAGPKAIAIGFIDLDAVHKASVHN